MSLLTDDQLWRLKANCQGTDPELFYPERGETVAAAKAVCRACECRSECLSFAMRNGERHGVWGGLSERERRRIRRHKQLKSCLMCGLAFFPITVGEHYCSVRCRQDAVRAV